MEEAQTRLITFTIPKVSNISSMIMIKILRIILVIIMMILVMIIMTIIAIIMTMIII